MKGTKLNHSDALKFILGGKSTFTFLNPKTENRFTYKVKKHKTDNVYFISVLTGPDAYTFIGSILDNTYRHSRKSKISIDSQSARVFDYILNKLNTNNLPDFIEIWHSGACGRCGRRLTTPESIERGFGPECIKLS
jgi:hypothetical protein